MKSCFMRKVLCLAGVLVLCGACSAQEAKNVILLIGDGMGPEQIKAAGMYANGEAGTLEMEKLPHKALVNTFPVKGPLTVTDSAAAGTALATGVKVYNTVLSLDFDTKTPIPTILEQFKAQGKRVGLVSTMYISHATPAAFGAHVRDRGMYDEIAQQLLTESRPHVMFGGVYPKTITNTPEKAKEAGYTVVLDRKEMEQLKGDEQYVIGQFGPGHLPYEYNARIGKTDYYQTKPHLHEMAAKALELLSKGDKGFFVMIEGGHIDSAGHDNNLPANIDETLEFDRTVAMVMKWAADRKDTLVIVTADHETGDLNITRNNGKGQLPGVAWGSGSHSGAKVPAFAWGPGSQAVTGILDNTDIHRIMAKAGGLTVAPTSQPVWATSQYSKKQEAVRTGSKEAQPATQPAPVAPAPAAVVPAATTQPVSY